MCQISRQEPSRSRPSTWTAQPLSIASSKGRPSGDEKTRAHLASIAPVQRKRKRLFRGRREFSHWYKLSDDSGPLARATRYRASGTSALVSGRPAARATRLFPPAASKHLPAALANRACKFSEVCHHYPDPTPALAKAKPSIKGTDGTVVTFKADRRQAVWDRAQGKAGAPRRKAWPRRERNG